MMKIPEELLNKWKLLRSKGDSLEMSKKEQGLYPELFNRAFKTGRAREQVVKVMGEFYEHRIKLLEQYIN